MIYRTNDPLRLAEENARALVARRELLAGSLPAIAAEISRLDHLIGEWSSQLPHGSDAPDGLVALYEERERVGAYLARF